MSVSRVFMILSLAVLVYILYTTINDDDDDENNNENLDNTLQLESSYMSINENDTTNDNYLSNSNETNETNEINDFDQLESVNDIENLDNTNETFTNLDNNQTDNNNFESRNIDDGFDYEDFTDNVNALTNDNNAAPVSEINNQEEEEEEENKEIKGTDLLASALTDRFNSVNSIANVNRNASNDLRGDIEVKFNEKYTPFYSSHIYGEPLHKNKLN